MEKVLNLTENKIINKKILNRFYTYIKYEDIEKVKEFILKIEKAMKLSINMEIHNRIISYVTVLLNCNGNYGENGEITAKRFILSTEEFRIIGKVLSEVFEKKCMSEENLIRIADLIMGMSINGLMNNSFEDWIDRAYDKEDDS